MLKEKRKMAKCDKCKQVQQILLKAKEQIHKLEHAEGKHVINADLVKAIKAMAYEKVLEVYSVREEA